MYPFNTTVIKRNEILMPAPTWMNLEITMLSEIKPEQRPHTFDCIYMKYPGRQICKYRK